MSDVGFDVGLCWCGWVKTRLRSGRSRRRIRDGREVVGLTARGRLMLRVWRMGELLMRLEPK